MLIRVEKVNGYRRNVYGYRPYKSEPSRLGPALFLLAFPVGCLAGFVIGWMVGG